MFNLLFFLLLATRFWNLGLKPPHHDEAINGWFVMQIWQKGHFTYDPTNYHGPLLFYLFQLAELFGGWGVESFRFVTVAFSAATILWLYRWTRRRLFISGWWALALALSPGFLFFSRSAIHEAPLLFFFVMATTGWIDFWCLRQGPRALIVFLYGVLGALLLKETFVIPLALGLLATAPLILKKEPWLLMRAQMRRLLFHFLVVVLVAAAFYSGFGHHPQGLVDFFAAFLPWMKTGVSGQGHEKEFLYFVKLILNYEPATQLALVLCLVGLFLRGWVCGVSLWAIGILLVYSIIPYKTPWCVISVQMPIWISAVVVLARLGFFWRSVWQSAFVLLGLISIPSYIALNFEPVHDPHPYIYVQTTYQAKTFATSILEQAGAKPDLWQSSLQIATNEAWPFPWWFQSFSKMASQPLSVGVFPNQDLYLVEVEDQKTLESQLRDVYLKSRFQVRDSREDSILYLRAGVFTCPFESCEEVKP